MKGSHETHWRSQAPSPEVKEIPLYPKNRIHVHTVNSTKLRKGQDVVAWLVFKETENSDCMDGNKILFFGGQGLGKKFYWEKFTFQDLS